MKKIIQILILFVGTITIGNAQNLLAIPDTLSGTNFNLNIFDTSKVFYTGYTTNTYGINANYFGPTLLLNQGDSISIHVNNQLMDTTTIHWHGLHVSAMNDGGPHIVIPPATTWNPMFKVRDHAATFWYHPHLHMMTNAHATLGAAGMIIVRDTLEAALSLPRRYAVDDFPLVLQSKCFGPTKEIEIDNAYDSVMLVNGTLDAYLPTPAQIVRFRILNASSERVYNIGLEGDLPFYQITTDGGLLDAPVLLTRLRLAPGERAEILVDLIGKEGQSIDILSFASELPNATYGALQPGMGPGQIIPGYATNVLNGADFQLMTINVVAQTATPITTIPSTLIANTPWPTASAAAFKTLTFTSTTMGPTAIQGPFLINSTSFDMNTVNYTIPLNNIEVWTLNNQSPIAHPFHIHDVQFYITEINGAAPPANMLGRKDVVLVPAMQTVKFITKFETFCDSMATYMYHCHMLPHEDDGMMGQFIVSCPSGVGINESEEGNNGILAFPNPTAEKLIIRNSTGKEIQSIVLIDNTGRIIYSANKINSSDYELNVERFSSGSYLLKIQSNNSVTHKKIILTK